VRSVKKSQLLGFFSFETKGDVRSTTDGDILKKPTALKKHRFASGTLVLAFLASKPPKVLRTMQTALHCLADATM